MYYRFVFSNRLKMVTSRGGSKSLFRQNFDVRVFPTKLAYLLNFRSQRIWPFPPKFQAFVIKNVLDQLK